MEPLLFNDKSIVPNNELIFSAIGKNKQHWEKLLQSIHQQYPDAVEQWNYYNDGKNWLFRMIRKKKTLFWIGVISGTFRITFYFGDKAEKYIDSADLPSAVIEQYKTGKRYGKIRAITLKVQGAEEIENAIKLTAVKMKV